MKSHRQSIKTTLEEVQIGAHEATIEFTRVTTWSHDAHYGADADGNRGVPMDFIDEDYAEGDVLIAFIEDDGPIPVLKIFQAEVDLAVTAHIERSEPTAPEYGERDYDDRDD